MKNFLLISLMAVCSIGCQDLEADIDLQEELLVIDGWVYDTEGPQTVKVSRSVAFEDFRNFEPINNASVLIRNRSNSEIEVFSEISSGIYLSSNTFKGIQGFSYQIEVRLPSGEIYRSDFEELKPVPSIDSLFLESFLDPEFSLIEPLEYFPVAIVQEFPEPGDFYRWKIARNNEFFNQPTDIILQSDRFVNGNLFKNELKDYSFLKNDTALVRLESLTSEAFNFLRFFRRQTTDLGTSGGTNPGALRGNIKNTVNSDEVVLGYFGASAVSQAEISIEE